MPVALSPRILVGNFLMSNQDPSAEQQPPTGNDPFADQPQIGHDPFADQPQMGQDRFAREASLQQTPTLQPKEIPAQTKKRVDINEQTAESASVDTAAKTEQASGTGVPVVQTRPRHLPASSFIPDIDPLYMLPLLLIPIALIWLWMRSRKNRLLKLQRYSQQFEDAALHRLNTQRQPVQRQPFRRRAANSPDVSVESKRFRPDSSRREERGYSFERSGEERQIGKRLTNNTPEQKSETASVMAANADRRQHEPELDKMFAADKEAMIERELDAGLKSVDFPGVFQLDDLRALADKFEREISRLKQTLASTDQRGKELDEALEQITQLNEHIRATKASWTQRFEEEAQLRQVLESRANKAESRLAESVEQSGVLELESKLSAVEAELEAAIAIKESLAAQVGELEALVKLSESEATQKHQSDQTALARSQEQATLKLAELEKSNAVALAAVKTDYVAKLSEAKADAAKQLAESESHTANVLAKAERAFAKRLAQAQEEATDKLADVESLAATKLAEAEHTFADRLANVQREAAEKLAKVESQATKTASEAERIAAAHLADERAATAAKLAEVEAQAAAKIAESEERLADDLSRYSTPEELAQLQVETAAKIADVEEKAAERIAEVQTNANSRVADVEAQAAVKLAKAEEDAANLIAQTRTEADARVAQIETQSTEKLAQAQTNADSRIAKVESELATKLAKAEDKAAAKIVDAQTDADAYIQQVESEAADKLARAEENAARIAEQLADTQARIESVASDAAAKIAALEAGVKQSLNSAHVGLTAQGATILESVAKLAHRYKKERTRRVDTEKMLEEAEVHRSVLSKQIKELHEQISSQPPGSD